ncbi:hypothetical protein LPY66_06580 [Dehalobacter sp. DCM]|uniref:hypothetical protein n=1 Tax=Dehalobacter sp. DCM TaxID=2907827 RepID=UPI0030817927|nr:hypothetical protein LPY66_06580 [Dehalobacter sp. DCM]
MPVTLNILLDHFPLVSYAPKKENPKFLGIKMLSCHSSRLSPDYLYVCNFTKAVKISQSFPNLYLLCPRDGLQEYVADNALRRVIMFDGKINYDSFFRFKEVFKTFKEWESNMQRSLIAGRGLQDLLDISENIIDSHIAVVDSGFNLLAYTQHTECEAPLILGLLTQNPRANHKLRYLNLSWESWSQMPIIIIGTIQDNRNYIHALKVLNNIAGNPVLVVLTCHCRQLTKGQYDKFSILLAKLSCSINTLGTPSTPSFQLVTYSHGNVEN